MACAVHTEKFCQPQFETSLPPEMKVVSHTIMSPQTATTIRSITVMLLVVVSLQNATAHDASPPTSILINIDQPLTAGRSYEVTCRAVGWEKLPRIFWWLGDQLQLTSVEQLLVSKHGNETLSVLLLTPSPDDNGQTLKCQAEGAHGMQENSVNLLVYYSPMVSLYVEPPLRPDDIREGKNITLKCHAQSNPPIWRVKWMFQGRLLLEADSSGPLNETLTLNLNAISRTQAGNYSCVVSNAMGDTDSLPLRLTVKHPPVCRSQSPLVYVTPPGKMVELDCGGDAVPPADSYRWMFSRAVEADGDTDSEPSVWRLRRPEGEKVTYLEWATGVSWRTYKPKNDKDYGTFYCSAKNALGLQQEPCVFHVVPPGRPNAPYNCSVLNETMDSFAVQCLTATDGGFRQSYHLEVFDAHTGRVTFNQTQPSPVFLVGGLEPSRPITMRIAAVSPGGRSEWVRMDTFTLEQTTTVSPVTQEKRK